MRYKVSGDALLGYGRGVAGSPLTTQEEAKSQGFAYKPLEKDEQGIEARYSRGLLGFLAEGLGMWASPVASGERVGMEVRKQKPFWFNETTNRGDKRYHVFSFETKDNNIVGRGQFWNVQNQDRETVSFLKASEDAGIYRGNIKAAEAWGTFVDKGTPQVVFEHSEDFDIKTSEGKSNPLPAQGLIYDATLKYNEDGYTIGSGSLVPYNLNVEPGRRYAAYGAAVDTLPRELKSALQED